MLEGAVLVFRKDGSYPLGDLSGWSTTIGNNKTTIHTQGVITSSQLFWFSHRSSMSHMKFPQSYQNYNDESIQIRFLSKVW